MKISVLRLGHRIQRDVRVTTHCCLAARALLADEMILSGERDLAIIETVRKVVKNWGGSFRISYEENWRKFLIAQKKRKSVLVHLTMYGHPLFEKLPEISRRARKKKIIVIVGAEKVPSEVYALADYNISVTNQPHSEVAALAIFLTELQAHAPLQQKARSKFRNARLRIDAGKKGKRIL